MHFSLFLTVAFSTHPFALQGTMFCVGPNRKRKSPDKVDALRLAAPPSGATASPSGVLGNPFKSLRLSPIGSGDAAAKKRKSEYQFLQFWSHKIFSGKYINGYAKTTQPRMKKSFEFVGVLYGCFCAFVGCLI